MKANKEFLKSAGIFLLFIIGFWAIANWYLSPANDGYALKQGDMQQVRLMKHGAEQVKEQTGSYPMWNDRLFSGMPSSLITGVEQGSLLLKYRVIELFSMVKSPFNFLFVAMISMFVLLLSVNVNQYLAAAGAIGYAFMTFSISSYEAGHITKVLSMGAMPGVFAGLVYLSKRKYLLGTALTAFFFATVVMYFHYQIVYYTGIMMVIYFVIQWAMAIYSKEFKPVLMASVLALLASVLGTLTCVGKLKDTNDYAKETMRGGSAVAEDGAGKAQGAQVGKNGLDRDYAFAWSYGIDETFTLLIPGFKGGSSGELVSDDRFGDDVRLPLYFGDLQFTSGPVYAGAAMMGLFIIGLVLAFREFFQYHPRMSKERLSILLLSIWLLPIVIYLIMIWYFNVDIKKLFDDRFPFYFPIMLILSIFTILRQFKRKEIDRNKLLYVGISLFGFISLIISIVLSWGKYFPLNNWLFDNLPYYNKFRTPMMALVIAQVVIPLVGFMGLGRLIEDVKQGNLDEKFTKSFLKNAVIAVAAVIGLAVLIVFSGDVNAPNDLELLKGENGRETLNAVKELRSNLVNGDIMRSLFLMLAGLGVVWGIMKKQINGTLAGVVLIVLVAYDMIGVSKRYLTDENWEEAETEESILPSPGDEAIKKANVNDQRVIDYRAGINRTFNDNTLGAFHRSIGGYHPAKMSRYQDVISNCIGATGPTGSGDLMNNHALDMLNCGFILGLSQDGKQEIPVARETALGHAWYVESIIQSPSAKQALMDINTKDVKKNAIFDPASESPEKKNYVLDSTSKITRIAYTNDSIEYVSNNANEGLAVFSEIYYNQKNGAWKVYIDGAEAKSYRADYILRSAVIPAGKHKILWKYVPEDRSGLVKIEMGSSLIILLLLLAPALQLFMGKKEEA